MKPKNTLIDNFFQAAGENDEKFLEALRQLGRAAMPTVTKGEGMVGEQRTPYANVGSRDVDQALCSVGEALHETLLANGWTEKQAADKLRVSETMILSFLAEMMPLSAGTVRGVTGFLCREHSLPEEAAQLLTEWLLNGLRLWELQHPPDAAVRHAEKRHKVGSIRIAARPNLKGIGDTPARGGKRK